MMVNMLGLFWGLLAIVLTLNIIPVSNALSSSPSSGGWNPNRRQLFQSAAAAGVASSPWFISPVTSEAVTSKFTPPTTPYLLPEYFQPPLMAPEKGRSYFPTLLPPLSNRATYLHSLGRDAYALEQLLAFQNVTASIRCTIVRLQQTGGLWVHSPLYPTGELCHLLDTCINGEVEHIVLPCNALEHKAPLKAFCQKYPQAQVWISPGQYGPFGTCGQDVEYDVDKTRKSMGLVRVDGILGDHMTVPPPSWADEFDMATLYVDIPQNAGPVSEVAFCHRPTKTLIATDAVVYIPRQAPPIFSTYFDPATLADTTFWARTVLQAVFLPLRIDEDDDDDDDVTAGTYPGYAALEDRLVRAPILRAFADARAPEAVRAWVAKIASQFQFDRIVTSHFASPVAATPSDFAACFSYLNDSGDSSSSSSSSSLPPITCQDWELLQGLNQVIADNNLGAPATFDYKKDCK